MAANFQATSTGHLETRQTELQTTRQQAEAFLAELTQVLQENPSAQNFHFQIQRTGVTPTAGVSHPINQGDGVACTMHPMQY